MRLYRITVTTESGFTSPLHSDTFFGAFCWSYRYLFGEEALLKDIIRPSAEHCPVCIFSNALPVGFLPRPMGIRDEELQDNWRQEDKICAKQSYQNAKKMKNASYISKEWFRKLQQGERAGFYRGLGKEPFILQQRVRNAVDRKTDTVKKTDEGSHLFGQDEYFLRDDRELDIYIYTILKPEKLLAVLQKMFQLGIGGKKSIGKGHFSICNPQDPLQSEESLLDVSGTDAVVSLSNYIPAQADPTYGFYKTFVKFGKLDREYADSENPFKKPLLFLQSGALFLTGEKKDRTGWMGRCLTGVSREHTNVIVSGYAIMLPIKFGRDKAKK